MFKEFKEFAMRGSVVDLAVGFVVGAAFASIVSSFVSDVLMPPIGLVLGNVDFADLFVVLKEGATAPPYASLDAAKTAGAVTLNYGMFANKVVSFLIIAGSVFFVVKGINSLKKKEEAPAAEPTTRQCPLCLETIPVKATRCGHCTSEIGEPKAA